MIVKWTLHCHGDHVSKLKVAFSSVQPPLTSSMAVSFILLFQHFCKTTLTQKNSAHLLCCHIPIVMKYYCQIMCI